MKSCEIELLGNAATLRSYTDARFKTMRLSVDLLLPLRAERASLYGILPGLVTRATREYPSFAALNQKLSSLYGATLSTSVRKMGAFQVLSLSASGISGRYAFGGDDMTAELSNLLLSAIFTPLFEENGLFPKEHFLQEQRQLLELKDAEYNDKVAYAHQRCEKLLLNGTPGAIDRYGEREEIQALSEAALPQAWNTVIQNARFELFALGDCTADTELLRQRFSSVGSEQTLFGMPYTAPDSLLRETEEQAVSQSKLSIGFRVDSAADERLLFQLMSAVFGGVPSSKLFQNVREKMGLCYYCSSSYQHLSRSLYVDSGVETENLEQAEQEIMEQLALLQQGEITEEELLSAKLALCNSFRSVGDSLGAVESWNLGQVFEEKPFTPEEAAERVMRFTADEVVYAARRVKPAAVFVLKGTGAN